jgi:hypothetical protein
MPHITRLLALVLSTLLLSSCAENLPQDIPRDYTAPYEHTFAVPFDRAWKGVVQAVSENSVIKTLDRHSGLIVTEYVTVDKKVLNMFETALFGRTYKNSYAITLEEVSPGNTRVRVQAHLMMEQFAVYNRERQVAWFEAYMRQELLRRICLTLQGDDGRCAMLFPDYNSAVCAPPPPVVVANGEQVLAVVTETKRPLADPSVLEVQRRLQDKGYRPGPLDGIMGRRTRAALARFQEEQGIEGGGFVNAETMAALGL